MNDEYHEQLNELYFVMKESAYLLNFGYQGIMSTIDGYKKMMLLCMT
jgi:hypothetical protein